MKSKYKAAFLIPKNTHRFLSENGWEFESNDRISNSIEKLLLKKFISIESKNDYSSYSYKNIKVTIFKDDEGKIENLYFQFHEEENPYIPHELLSFVEENKLYFFIPNDKDN